MSMTTCTIAALSSRSNLHARSVSAPRIWRLQVCAVAFFSALKLQTSYHLTSAISRLPKPQGDLSP
jgi:hypothetical protein